ncbi:MAG: chemotaxis protein CheR [Phycisphaerae bacterium]|nr:chemotaxis protein CheR [Phycisphaerae bacterium]
MAVTTETRDLTRKEYERIRDLVYANSGINLGNDKMQLVRTRLGKRVRNDGFSSFGEYLRHVEQDSTGAELGSLLDAISTNTTHLFREMRHFEMLRSIITTWIQDKNWRAGHSEVRIWSAASSSGEEPHSIAMTVHHALSGFPGIGLKILATDISMQMLHKAKRGIYESHRVGTAPADYRNRYFRKIHENGQSFLQIVPELSSLITFTRFNLMTPTFPFRHGFDVIFCRNVMIYFDRPTQETLVNKLAHHLHPGGYLMIGHSESLNGIQHPLNYIEPTVYRK